MSYALTEAVKKLSAKSPVGSRLSSAEWEQVPLAIRERAQFSARVESARVMQAIQDKLMKRITLAREAVENGTALVDRSSFIGDLRKIVMQEGLGTGTGSITDLSSRRRLGLIFDMQVGQAQNFAKWKTGQDPDVLDAAPAQELVRKRRSRVERDWAARWRAAGGEFYEGGRMIALKTDPIWEEISRFGTPWPPFDYNSGMGLRNVRRREAERLGLVKPKEKLTPRAESFNEDLAASTRSLNDDFKQALEKQFGGLADQSGGEVRFRGLAAAAAKAIRDYTAMNGSLINDKLRAGTAKADDLAQAASIDEGLKQLPAAQGTVWRGIDDVSDADLGDYLRVGAIVTEPAFTSASRKASRARGGDVEMIIQSLTGKDVSIYSEHPNEQEVLFARDTRFRVLEVTQDGDRKVIRLEEVHGDE